MGFIKKKRYLLKLSYKVNRKNYLISPGNSYIANIKYSLIRSNTKYSLIKPSYNAKNFIFVRKKVLFNNT